MIVDDWHYDVWHFNLEKEDDFLKYSISNFLLSMTKGRNDNYNKVFCEKIEDFNCVSTGACINTFIIVAKNEADLQEKVSYLYRHKEELLDKYFVISRKID